MNKRKIFPYIMVTAFFFLASFDKNPSDRSLDETEIRNNAKAYAEAYNQHDVDKLAKFWAQDATYINPVTGDIAEGRAAITEAFKEKFSGDDLPKIEITIDKIEFKEADKAIEKGHVKITHKDMTEENTAYEAQEVKEDGKWVLQQVREITIEQAPSHYEQLKDLEWLVGKWMDEDDNVDIRFNTVWDKNKNFLIQQFSMKVLNQDEIEGQQYIGWDPIKEKVRSWVFDSDGGYGEGYWSKQNGRWYANMTYTLADGSRGSSTNIYTKVNGSYTFASESRDVNGELLPNIEPIKVVTQREAK